MPRWTRILSMASGSVIHAMMVALPPHDGSAQTVTSIANTRARSLAQATRFRLVHGVWGSFESCSIAEDCSGWLVDDRAMKRLLATMILVCAASCTIGDASRDAVTSTGEEDSQYRELSADCAQDVQACVQGCLDNNGIDTDSAAALGECLGDCGDDFGACVPDVPVDVPDIDDLDIECVDIASGCLTDCAADALECEPPIIECDADAIAQCLEDNDGDPLAPGRRLCRRPRPVVPAGLAVLLRDLRSRSRRVLRRLAGHLASMRAGAAWLAGDSLAGRVGLEGRARGSPRVELGELAASVCIRSCVGQLAPDERHDRRPRGARSGDDVIRSGLGALIPGRDDGDAGVEDRGPEPQSVRFLLRPGRARLRAMRSMNLELDDRRALVLGSSAGIGRGVAGALIADGARVALSGRDRERLDAAVADLGAAAGLAVDLEATGAGTDLVTRAVAALGGLDILVTNCGGPPKGRFLDIDGAAWERAYRGVWMSAVDSIRAALPAMIERGWGRIVMITSSTGREPIPGLTLSSSLRPGLHGLANSLCKEVADSGVTVNVIMPGTIDTARIAELPIGRDELVAAIPAGRLGRPEEIGWLAAFLASERAGYITGQAIACDGGRMASI